MRIIHNEIFNTLEIGMVEGAVQLCHSGSELCWDVFVTELGEVTIAEIYIFYVAVRTAFDDRHLGRK